MRQFGLLLLPLAAVACAGDGSGGALSGEPNGVSIVVVSIDTLRADRVEPWSDAVPTPHLRELARESVVFDRAYAHYPLTLPSHASILTGTLPLDHGVRDNFGFALPEQAETLAESLGQAGYRTIGAVSAAVLDRSTGIAQGFEQFDDTFPTMHGRGARVVAQRPGEQTIEAALELLDGTSDERPFFLFVHLFEPHTPYAPPEPFTADHPYDGEVRYADALVGRLVDALRERGIYDRVVFSVLSDHGEGLGDHVEQEHGLLLYNEVLHVPWLVRRPGGAGPRHVDVPVGLIDVTPTLLGLAGIDPGPDRVGRALLSGERPTARRLLYAETFFPRHQYGWSELRSVVRDELHYIEAPRPELYDLVADPAERNDLFDPAEPPLALQAVLREFGSGIEARADVSAEQQARLVALGYVGTGGATAPGADLPDPKDRIVAREELWAFVDEDSLRPVPLTTARVGELLELIGPDNELLHRGAARGLGRTGRARDGLALLERYAESDDDLTQLALGDLALEAGEMPRAARHFERAVRLRPDNVDALTSLGLLQLEAGRPDGAAESLGRAVALDATRADAWNGIGVARAQRGDLAAAGEAWARAVEHDPALADAWYNLALTRHRAGRRTEARDALERYAALVSGAERREAETLLRSW